jgi:hypothetical protein
MLDFGQIPEQSEWVPVFVIWSEKQVGLWNMCVLSRNWELLSLYHPTRSTAGLEVVVLTDLVIQMLVCMGFICSVLQETQLESSLLHTYLMRCFLFHNWTIDEHWCVFHPSVFCRTSDYSLWSLTNCNYIFSLYKYLPRFWVKY